MTSPTESAPPRRFRQTSYGVLEIRDGGGWFTLLGLPFLGGGAVMVALFTGLLPLKPVEEGKWTHAGFVLMGLAFLIVGVVLVFGRQWLTLDVTRGLVVIRQGLLVPMRTRERSLTEFSAVSLHRIRGDSESVDRFPVELRARIGKSLTISRPSKFGEAIEQAQYLAVWLRLPLADESTEHEKALPEAIAAGAPERPPKMLSQVFESAGEVKIVIPGDGNKLAGVVAALFATFMLLVLFPLLRKHASFPPQVLFLIVGIFVVPQSLLLIALIAGKRKRTIVKASRAALEITPAAWGAPPKIIPADQIVDVDFSTFEGALRAVRRSPDQPRGILGFLAKRMPGDGIIVKSKQDWINFGEKLPADELRYLAWLLRKTLAVPAK